MRTPAEILAERQAGASQGRTAAEILAARKQAEKESSIGTQALDLAKSFGTGARNMYEGLGEMAAGAVANRAMAPLDMAAQFAGAEEAPSQRLTKSILAPSQEALHDVTDPLLEPEIPVGEGGEWFERGRTGSRIAGEYAMPGSLGGKAMTALPKVGAFIGGVTGGTAGQELAGTGGEIAGTILGDIILQNPAQAARNVVTMLKTPADKAKALKNMVKKGDVDLGSASNQETANALFNLSNQFDIHGMSIKDAQKYLTKQFEKVKKAREDGSNLTIGQITEDAGVLAYEADMARQAVKGSESSAHYNAARELTAKQHRLAEETRAPMEAIAPEGVPSRAGALPRTTVAAEKKKIREAAETAAELPLARSKAERQAWQLNTLNEANPAGQPRVADIGRKGFKQLGKNINKAYDAAWASAGGLKPAAVQKIQDRIAGNITDFTQAESRMIKNIYDDAEKMSQGRTKTKLKALDRSIREAREGAMNAGRTEVVDLLEDLRGILRASTPQKTQDALKAADANYPNYRAVVEAGGGTKAPFTRQSDFTGSDLAGGSKKQVGSRRVAEGTAPLTAQVDEGVRLDDAAKAAEAQAKALRDDAARAVKEVEKSGPGIFAQAEPSRWKDRVKAVMGDKFRTARVAELVASVGDDAAAKDNLRRAFAEELQVSVAKDGKINKGATDDFKEMRKVYEESGLFTPDELDRVQEGLVEGQKLYLHDADKLAQLPKEQRRLLEVFSGLTGAKLGALAFGSPLIGAAYGRSIATKMSEKMTKGRVNDLTYELVTNPEKFADIIERLDKRAATKAEVDKAIQDMLLRAGAVGARATAGQGE